MKLFKIIILIMVGLGIALYFSLNAGEKIDYSNKADTYTGLTYIKDAGVIDKKLVVKSFSKSHQLVSIEGYAEKSYTYTDSLFNKGGWLKDKLGRRVLGIDANVYFKTGINLGEIKDGDIQVYDNTLIINTPKPVLISLDIPYDEMAFKSKTGLFRGKLNDTEKQSLYTEMRKLITNDIMEDKDVRTKTINEVQEAIRILMEKVPNVDQIVFR